MDKLKMQSVDGVARNIDKILELFPNAETEILQDGKPTRAVDFDVLKQELAYSIIEGPEERYQFTWPDKRETMLKANLPIPATLRPVYSDVVKDDGKKIRGSVGRDGAIGGFDSENLYIEGDNLEVLKILREAYLGRVKMIYIDPPYNTGKNLIYNDNFAQSTEEYIENSGQLDEQGNRMEVNPESNGRFHTDWLNMMYPRLKLAKDLLSENGAIFVNIDYNEVANLYKLMFEIFGENNFQREIIWRIGWLSGFKTATPNFIRNHDTILFFSRDPQKLDFHKKYILNEEFKPLIKKDKHLTQKFESLGLTTDQQKEILQFINHDNRPEKYPIEDTWNCNEYDDLNSIAIVSFSSEKISKILDINQEFVGQKAIAMLKRIIASLTNKDDIVMDFFAGTSSTAHAVMQLNAEDGGKRKFIMVQIPEKCGEKSEAFKAGYENICEIGKERIRRAGKKIKEENPLTTQDLDVGFRCLRLDTSNMKDVYYRPEELRQENLFDKVDNVKEDRSPEDLLFQVMPELCADFSSKIEEKKFGGKKVFCVEDNYLVACFDNDVADETVTAMAKMKPQYAVLRDKSMKDDSVAVNFEQIFKTYSPDTKLRVL